MIEILYLILGILIFFVPGYLLSLLLYPNGKDLDFWERIGASFGLGALVITLIIAILAQPWLRALRLVPFLGAVILFCMACGAFLIYREGGLDRALQGLIRPLKSSSNDLAEEEGAGKD